MIARQVMDGTAASGNTKYTRKPVIVQPTASQLKPDQYQYRPSFDGRPVYCHNWCGTRSYVRGTAPLAPGPRIVEIQFDYDGGGLGKGGTVHLFVDRVEVAACRLEHTVSHQFSVSETMDVGCDRGTPVTDEYPTLPSQNRYRGRLEQVNIALGRNGEMPSEEERHDAAMIEQ
ncbi:hypothetical protein AB0I53_23460 [Saccharopolyspora sp. NPDC050389]|uniref:hypothetical protein n=1 Tax=Saccharopolyspora sp. NPDC050389 TaxID=3155516 RepID=UPI0033DB3C0A